MESKPPACKNVTLKDCEFSFDLPTDVQCIADLHLRQRAGDAWLAAMTILRAIDLFRDWTVELEETGDAHPAVPTRLLPRLFFAIGSLCRSGIDHSNFQPENEKDLCGLFPGYVYPVTSLYPPPEYDDVPGQLGPFAPWQIRYRAEYRNKRSRWWGLEGRLRGVLELLKFPSTAFREGSKPPAMPPPDGRERLRQLAVQLTRLENRILEYLWDCSPVDFDTFHRCVWSEKLTQVGAAQKAIDRLNTKLCELKQHDMRVESANGIVQLIRDKDK